MNTPTVPLTIEFNEGTLLIDAAEDSALPLAQWCTFDKRVNCWRAPACSYRSLVTYLYRNGIAYIDNARKFSKVPFAMQSGNTGRDYQKEAVEAWQRQNGCGLVVLPTGTGKTFVAKLAICALGRSTLVVVPTIDLMLQWSEQLGREFGCEIGMYGGGSKELRDITVATYDSALLIMPSMGCRFGLLVVDECHHLPGATYKYIAQATIAPFRLGLTATPERTEEEGLECYNDLLGPVCFRRDIDEMGNSVLANYETKLVYVTLMEDEFQEYRRNREIYVNFIHRCKIDFSAQGAWRNFIVATVRNPGGREALKAYYAQKKIATSGRMKILKLWQLLCNHRDSRILVFTADNKTAYDIGERFYLPVITHHTKANERKDFLSKFRTGEYPVLVTSKVLNEGVDVPEADVGIVVSGSGSIREHVQRLGRILRPSPGKRAVLYEIVTVDTAEDSISERRRNHRAYERPGQLYT